MKKWILGVVGLFVAVTLAGCSSGTVANMKGAKITKDEYYNAMKKTTTGQATLRNMIVLKALEQQYPNKVSDKKVNSQFNKLKKQYGSSFDSTLEQNGYTESSFKDQIRTTLYSEVALKDMKKPTTKQIEAQWKKYQPKIQVQHILVKTEDEAKQIISDYQKDPTEKNFEALAKKNSIDTGTKNKGGKLTAFDNTDTSLDSTFKAAAFKLKKPGDITTTPVKTQYGYHVIRAISIGKKGTMKEHKKDLENQIYTSWQSDQTVMNGVITKVLKKANVSIKDNDLKDVLSSYLSSGSSSSSTSN
ncbi:peptidylprolyl isomerase [Lacticaseibacillus casei]|jgi:foldase protein PrsA|uniref:Foldase protein PrsA n=1 Tax=Lacticaseibacillus huelsenbergensis TaxID=3035291 RepID=A0ABY8DQE1_9LACO|nr:MULTISPECIES: peptidylprolyl isomerase [Lacticaseibacillus]MDG3060534.1 peptidylprolyl isomerase [Lacticaseibacillus sp. BCRC 81376]QVI37556.1 peptidylprolyl isomerase [Lacticaseibacillus casei]QXG59343.1 peptidylprolyl isomerase [Lacticaseibacillus casei]WFB39199.1 peptidylprolyl isomerase [Lacticaseibacillus huelsenbergensis]WFB40901.1 peptidylprolyl isomerase [Lacticaseibacillus huelsenbergensis]